MKTTIFFFILLGFIANIPAQEFKPGDHELMLMPTAYTMPAGNSYFTDYEVVLLNYCYAPGSSTHLGIFTLFPITTDFLESVTLGIKQNVFRSENFSTSFYSSYTPKSGIFSFGNVISIGKPSKSVHASLAYFKGENSNDEQWVIMLGGRIDPSENVSLIAEYTNIKNSSWSNDFNGLVTFGVRLRSTNMSWELCGMRPLEDAGDLIMIPLLKATYYFQ